MTGIPVIRINLDFNCVGWEADPHILKNFQRKSLPISLIVGTKSNKLDGVVKAVRTICTKGPLNSTTKKGPPLLEALS